MVLRLDALDEDVREFAHVSQLALHALKLLRQFLVLALKLNVLRLFLVEFGPQGVELFLMRFNLLRVILDDLEHILTRFGRTRTGLSKLLGRVGRATIADLS